MRVKNNEIAAPK